LTQDVIEEVLYVKFLFLIIFFVHGMTYLIGNWKLDWKIFLQYSKVGIA
jgi:hypothetical protein